MKEGDEYPHLKLAKIHRGVNPIMIRQPSTVNWSVVTDQTHTIAVHDVERLQTVVVELPERDWDGIMEIYRAHYHAGQRNAAVLHAWAQYQLLMRLTK